MYSFSNLRSYFYTIFLILKFSFFPTINPILLFNYLIEPLLKGITHYLMNDSPIVVYAYLFHWLMASKQIISLPLPSSLYFDSCLHPQQASSASMINYSIYSCWLSLTQMGVCHHLNQHAFNDHFPSDFVLESYLGLYLFLHLKLFQKLSMEPFNLFLLNP